MNRQRIVGLENELGTANCKEKDIMKVLACFGFFGAYPIIIASARNDDFTENGSRFYIDIGLHPEISTPECSNVYDLVKYSRANERVLEEKEKFIKNTLPHTKFNFVKNNYDFITAGEIPSASYGCHENYQVLSRFTASAIAEKIAPFLATRQLINGAGAIYKNKFFISSRGLTINSLYNTQAHGSTSFKPMILQRDESFSPANFRRLQIVCGEANMMEWALYVSIGSTRLILEMMENNFLGDLIMPNPILAFQQISKDLNLNYQYSTNRGNLTALEIQQLYLENGQEWLEYLKSKEIATEEDKQIINSWAITLDLLKNNQEELIGKLDWISKKFLIDQRCLRKNLPLDHPEPKAINIQYHFINRDEGLSHLFYKKGIAARIVKEEEIEIAENNPPGSTRAYVRTKICKILKKLAQQNIITYHANWNSFYIEYTGSKKEITLSLTDPFNTDLDSKLFSLASQGLPITS